ncbi:hypothetical protein TRAPUB_10349 [Trametes pubescens]|uniref:Uncharacterized protein n=1 Tax=Trametes pubescens TaxID=154538 RepID=A0A1M2VZN6_TRAPU|nr:hypothetical protein TRAPUB_10349 [Trametes pubescens]
MDPALTVLAIRRLPSASASGTTRSRVSQVLIVPVSTISSFMPAPFAHVAPSSSSPKHIPVVIPFDDWATRDGAVTVTTPGRNLCFAAIGSQCVLVNHVLEKSYEGLSMLLVDVHSGARYNSHKEFHLPPVKHDSYPAGATLTASYSINLGYTTALPYKRIFVEMPMFSGYDSVVSIDLFPDQCVFQFEDVSGNGLFPVAVGLDANRRVRCIHKRPGVFTFEDQAHACYQ